MSYNNYFGRTGYVHGTPARIGVLITNLGTPDAPTPAALRVYLRQFLADPRVIELNPVIWWLVRNFFVLPTRPRQSAKLYREIWTERGSPLLFHTLDQAEGIRSHLGRYHPGEVVVEIGMRYGNPSLESALKKMVEQGVERLLVVPMYPQYSATTTASTFDEITRVLQSFRWIPEFRMIGWYHDDPGYISALTESIRELWAKEGEPERLLFSYHGIPQRYFDNGDPYFCHCQKTSRLVAEQLELPRERYLVCFQSIFGREEWIKPPTIDTIRRIAQEGVRSLDVICPGFSADCLETIEEIDVQNREAFLESGGERFRYIPA